MKCYPNCLIHAIPRANPTRYCHCPADLNRFPSEPAGADQVSTVHSPLCDAFGDSLAEEMESPLIRAQESMQQPELIPLPHQNHDRIPGRGKRSRRAWRNRRRRRSRDPAALIRRVPPHGMKQSAQVMQA
ncbi:hypothetical protein L6164_000650 [Bauhinia variegata]|uniref:Uncharacterized protein n=1 Tax=Bauhinia variegata TaxID=167791 RepID=A0ACB9Q975_BAUVA|nr:hypothetical protein L6164_000650 [Bauhinia variegata]